MNVFRRNFALCESVLGALRVNKFQRAKQIKMAKLIALTTLLLLLSSYASGIIYPYAREKHAHRRSGTFLVIILILYLESLCVRRFYGRCT